MIKTWFIIIFMKPIYFSFSFCYIYVNNHFGLLILLFSAWPSEISRLNCHLQKAQYMNTTTCWLYTGCISSITVLCQHMLANMLLHLCSLKYFLSGHLLFFSYTIWSGYSAVFLLSSCLLLSFEFFSDFLLHLFMTYNIKLYYLA